LQLANHQSHNTIQQIHTSQAYNANHRTAAIATIIIIVINIIISRHHHRALATITTLFLITDVVRIGRVTIAPFHILLVLLAIVLFIHHHRHHHHATRLIIPIARVAMGMTGLW
jgi:hypothetical protein